MADLNNLNRLRDAGTASCVWCLPWGDSCGSFLNLILLNVAFVDFLPLGTQ